MYWCVSGCVLLSRRTLAVLRNPEFYAYRKEECCSGQWGLYNTRHPHQKVRVQNSISQPVLCFGCSVYSSVGGGVVYTLPNLGLVLCCCLLSVCQTLLRGGSETNNTVTVYTTTQQESHHHNILKTVPLMDMYMSTLQMVEESGDWLVGGSGEDQVE